MKFKNNGVQDKILLHRKSNGVNVESLKIN